MGSSYAIDYYISYRLSVLRCFIRVQFRCQVSSIILGLFQIDSVFRHCNQLFVYVNTNLDWRSLFKHNYNMYNNTKKMSFKGLLSHKFVYRFQTTAGSDVYYPWKGHRV